MSNYSEVLSEKWESFKVWMKSTKAGTSQYIRKKRNVISSILKGENIKAIKKGVLTILMDGLIFSIAISYWYPLEWKNILILGCLWFILTEKVIPQLIKVLRSINLLKLGK